jgi:TolB-like protein
MSADPEGDFFADGIADEIITALSKVKALKVSSRTSSFTFKGKGDDIREIGRKLQVSTILEGSIRKSGKRLRLNAQLVNGPSVTTESSRMCSRFRMRSRRASLLRCAWF